MSPEVCPEIVHLTSGVMSLTKEQNRIRMARIREQYRRENPEQILTGKVRNGINRQQYADWLRGYNWDYFFTTTFRRPRKEPYYAIQSVWHTLEQHNVKRGFLGCEPHQSGDLHIHGIVAGAPPRWQPEIDLPWEIYGDLFKNFGRSKVEACNSHEAVTAYCSKYILKQQSRVCDFYEVFGTRLDWVGGRLTDSDIINV